ncbi:hypothetical protein OKW46_001565 [Paraburkholderia sp. WSM4179]|nr:hypothetical protein [Paraburkholderia sp. WSM4179]
MLLKIYIYGYLDRVQFSRRLERECQRNVELMWLSLHWCQRTKPSAQRLTAAFDRTDFIYIAKDDQCLCPAGQRAIYPT